jgi:hypothetical protein
MAIWVILFAIVNGNIGSSLGIHYLFLDPEYLNSVGFRSFLIMGVVIAGFSVAFHITAYITDGHRFTFLGQLAKPFSLFSINNSVIPIAFLIFYLIKVVSFQVDNEYGTTASLVRNLGGFMVGYISMVTLLYIYFRNTNKDIFKYVVCKVDEKLKQNIKVTRRNVMEKLDVARKKQIRVDNYLGIRMRFRKVPDYQGFYDKATILQVFDQNHLNLVLIELFIFVLLLIIGVFRDYPVMQIPAAASGILFLSVFVMFAGAFSYWFRSWAVSAVILLGITLNFIVQENFLKKNYEAFGLNYDLPEKEYNLKSLSQTNSPGNILEDWSQTKEILENWRGKFPEINKPTMVFICASGGGQRASLWTMKALQAADSATNGQLMENTVLITGASGGLIGAGYFRELYLRKKKGDPVNLQNHSYLQDISNDNLNPIIFSLLVNDLIVSFQKFSYANMQYPKDRGYSFEEQLNKNTRYFLDKPLSTYKEPELKSEIPMMILAPTIMNDGRKLFISPQNVSYLNIGLIRQNPGFDTEIEGLDFHRFFEDYGSNDLRFLSALRMSATFPYITPSVTLPSNPPIEIMDSGVTDNFGISDALRFIYAYKDWIARNTRGVLILAIRDSQKQNEILSTQNLTLIQKFSNPISSIYNNFENLQDFNNDNKIIFANSWFQGEIQKIDLQYIPRINSSNKLERASLNWRLTSLEKNNIIDAINSPSNQKALELLKRSLSPNPLIANED